MLQRKGVLICMWGKITILGDKLVEGDETFVLEVSNAVGFSLPVKLIAMHTIVDNDTLL